ncbi:hypothetical protein [Ekhidna sp. To15]|uniref:hypothetical protein n=1 Tax=Ekhidna sp. To15 TaxID=3395267 RepID=UPI003F51B130
MKKITNHLLVLVFLFSGASCVQQEAIELELTSEQKFELLRENLKDLTAHYNGQDMQTEMKKIIINIFGEDAEYSFGSAYGYPMPENGTGVVLPGPGHYYTIAIWDGECMNIYYMEGIDVVQFSQAC